MEKIITNIISIKYIAKINKYLVEIGILKGRIIYAF